MINSGDTAFIIICTALVMLMTPGLALFYSGMVRDKNAIATIMHSFMKLCIISIVWVLWGYSFAFGEDKLGGFIGGINFFGLCNINTDLMTNTSIPHLLFAVFQGMFATITVAIITGSFAERVRLGPILIFGIAWVTIVYAPIAHWIWGGGWIQTKIGMLDFAGGAVVHISSATAGLVAAIFLGKRKSLQLGESDQPHNITLTVIGASLLWFGWFGFNAGSALAANNIAVLALVNTNVAAASGAAAWFLIELFSKDRVTIIGAISGAVSGLVAITPAAGFVSPSSSIVIGLIAGVLCYVGIKHIKPKIGYDDSLDAFGIHGIAGIWGAIATGIFASLKLNPAGADGLIFGNYNLIWAQIGASFIIIIYSAFATFVILKIISIFTNIRVSHNEEFEGLDSSQHGEKCYNIK